jgi:hypothetical protein
MIRHVISEWNCKYSKEDRRDEQEWKESVGLQQFKSKMDQLEEEKRRIERTWRSRRGVRTWSLNSTTQTLWETGVIIQAGRKCGGLHGGGRNNLDTPWVVHASPISPSDFIDLKAGAWISYRRHRVIRIGNWRKTKSMFSAWTQDSLKVPRFHKHICTVENLCRPQE